MRKTVDFEPSDTVTGMKTRSIAYDCRYFLGDRPCVWHKQEGVICECDHYVRLGEKLLIIKLDAMGDVLRTTCLLPIICRAWPDSRITWITRAESAPLLENNPYVTEVVTHGSESLVHLLSRTFDRVLNLDTGKVSAGLATAARAKEKIGYVLHPDGYVMGSNRSAIEWLKMGIFDDFKRANKRTYQEIMCDILGLPSRGLKYVLELTEAERKEAHQHLLAIGIETNKSIVGIHTGGGTRWRLKQWGEESFIRLIHELVSELGQAAQILLFGGPTEVGRNRRIKESTGDVVFDAGCQHKLRHFAALVSNCSVVVSADSLAMHVALALRRRLVVLFGPTSSTEIELFGLGEKVVPDLDCLACYKETCDFVPNCMDSISVSMVKEAVLRQLSVAGHLATNREQMQCR